MTATTNSSPARALRVRVSARAHTHTRSNECLMVSFSLDSEPHRGMDRFLDSLFDPVLSDGSAVSSTRSPVTENAAKVAFPGQCAEPLLKLTLKDLSSRFDICALKTGAPQDALEPQHAKTLRRSRCSRPQSGAPPRPPSCARYRM